MKDFISLFKLAFNLIRRPDEFRGILVTMAGKMQSRIYVNFLVPIMFLGSVCIALPYYLVDGIKVALVAFLINLVSGCFKILILGGGIILLLKRHESFTHQFMYCLAFAFFWLFLGEIVKTTMGITLGVIGNILGGWPVLLGSIWLVDFCIKEFLFALVPIEIPRLKALSNSITIFLVLFLILISEATQYFLQHLVVRIL